VIPRHLPLHFSCDPALHRLSVAITLRRDEPPPPVSGDSYAKAPRITDLGFCRIARLVGYDGGMEDAAPSLQKIRFRKLRIAWSVLTAGACVCLIVFWARSFRIADSFIEVRNGCLYQFSSVRGELAFGIHPEAYHSGDYRSWRYVQLHIPDDWHVKANILGFRFFSAPNVSMIPYWFVLFLTAGIGIVPWIHWSFSLRTMLIAVTAIAVFLGLARLATILTNQ